MVLGNSGISFLDSKSFTRDEAPFPAEASAQAIGSPFVNIYESPDGEVLPAAPVREAVAGLLHELHDDEFDEALYELYTDARNLHQNQLDQGRSSDEAERVVTQHFAQFVSQSEAAVDALRRQVLPQEAAGLVDREVDTFVAEFRPTAAVEPAFENFFGKLLKKVGRAVKTAAGAAWRGIKKVGLGFIFDKLKAALRPLLNQVLQKAIGKLPQAVQPAAAKLAARLGFATAAPVAAAPANGSQAVSGAPAGDPGSPVQEPAGADPSATQQEFDQQIAEALLAEDEAELALEVARLGAVPNTAAPVFSKLEQARSEFIQKLGSLNQGESAEPQIQNFLPALLPALKVGFRLIGRPRVVNFLANLLAKLIAGLIGPEQAPALSRAIVDSGLRLLSLEMSDNERAGLGAASVAATVEETVSRVAALPDHVLDRQELLEGFALEAFEQAAAANLPAVLSEATYKQRPELLEAGVNAGWVLLPFRRPRYKRCSRRFKVRITPHLAENVESFEGEPLSEYLQDQLGVPEGAEVEGELDLYEALPGGSVVDIARGEAETSGVGGVDEAALAELHPLTHEAASHLLGMPGLGRALPFGSSRRNLYAGQRLYHLRIAGRRPLWVTTGLGRPRVRRLSHLDVTLDALNEQLRVSVFLSETKAQRLAVRLRQPAHAGMLSVNFQKFLARRLPPVLQGLRAQRLRVVHPGVAPGQPVAALMQKLPRSVARALVEKLQAWLLTGFADFVKNGAQGLQAAAQAPADGVTLRFTLERPPGFKELCQALVDKGPAVNALLLALNQPEPASVRVEVFPGHTK